MTDSESGLPGCCAKGTRPGPACTGQTGMALMAIKDSKLILVSIKVAAQFGLYHFDKLDAAGGCRDPSHAQNAHMVKGVFVQVEPKFYVRSAHHGCRSILLPLKWCLLLFL